MFAWPFYSAKYADVYSIIHGNEFKFNVFNVNSGLVSNLLTLLFAVTDNKFPVVFNMRIKWFEKR